MISPGHPSCSTGPRIMSSSEPGFTTGFTLGIAGITLLIWEGGRFLLRMGGALLDLISDKRLIFQPPRIRVVDREPPDDSRINDTEELPF